MEKYRIEIINNKAQSHYRLKVYRWARKNMFSLRKNWELYYEHILSHNHKRPMFMKQVTSMEEFEIDVSNTLLMYKPAEVTRITIEKTFLTS